MTMLNVKIKSLNALSYIPKYQTSGASGVDLCACENKSVNSGSAGVISTGIAVEIPPGHEGQVRSRSGLAMEGLFVLNSPGTIDSDYRGEVKVILMNLSGKHFEIHLGDRIAQLVFCPVVHARIQRVSNLSNTERGSGGLGSTGISS